MCTNYSPAKVERLRVRLELGPPREYPSLRGESSAMLPGHQKRPALNSLIATYLLPWAAHACRPVLAGAYRS